MQVKASEEGETYISTLQAVVQEGWVAKVRCGVMIRMRAFGARNVRRWSMRLL